MWFIGQKVVCINDRFSTHILEWTANLPRQGQIYTIRSIEIGHCLYTRQWTLGLHLQELPTIEDRLAFRADRFIPLAEKRDQARQATASDLIMEVGDAAMKSVAQKMESGTLPQPGNKEVLDLFANSRPQLEQLPPGLRKAVEQMLWRSKAASKGLSKSLLEITASHGPRWGFHGRRLSSPQNKFQNT